MLPCARCEQYACWPLSRSPVWCALAWAACRRVISGVCTPLPHSAVSNSKKVCAGATGPPCVAASTKNNQQHSCSAAAQRRAGFAITSQCAPLRAGSHRAARSSAAEARHAQDCQWRSRNAASGHHGPAAAGHGVRTISCQCASSHTHTGASACARCVPAERRMPPSLPVIARPWRRRSVNNDYNRSGLNTFQEGMPRRASTSVARRKNA